MDLECNIPPATFIFITKTSFEGTLNQWCVRTKYYTEFVLFSEIKSHMKTLRWIYATLFAYWFSELNSPTGQNTEFVSQ